MRLQLRGLRQRALPRTEARLNLCAPGGKDTARKLKASRRSCRRAGGRRQREPGPACRTGARGRPRRRLRPRSTAPLRRRAREKPGSRPSSAAAASTPRTPRRRPATSRSTSPPAASPTWSAIPSASSPRTPPRSSTRSSARSACPRAADLGRRGPAPSSTGSLIRTRSGAAPDALFLALAYETGDAHARKRLERWPRARTPTATSRPSTCSPPCTSPAPRPVARAAVEALEPFQPRLYSISSSPRANPGQVTLTVGRRALHARATACASASPRPISATAPARRRSRSTSSPPTASRCPTTTTCRS